MTRDTLARVLAISAIMLALFLSSASESCNCSTNHGRRNLLGRVIRWVTWITVKDEFQGQPPAQDPGVLRSENAPPVRKKTAAGEVQLDHGHGW